MHNREDISISYQELHASSFEISDGAVSVVLIDTTVQRHARVTTVHEAFGEVVCVFLFIDEHQNRAGFLVQTEKLE